MTSASLPQELHIHKGLVLRLVFQGPLSLRYATVQAHPAVWKYHSPPVFLPPLSLERLVYWRSRDRLRQALRENTEEFLYA